MSKRAKSFQEMVYRLFGMNPNSTFGHSKPWNGPRFVGQPSMPTINARTLDKHNFRVEEIQGARYLSLMSLDNAHSWALLKDGEEAEGVFDALASMPFLYKGNNSLIADCQYLLDAIDNKTLTMKEAYRVINDIQRRAFTLQRIALEGSKVVAEENQAEERMKKCR